MSKKGVRELILWVGLLVWTAVYFSGGPREVLTFIAGGWVVAFLDDVLLSEK